MGGGGGGAMPPPLFPQSPYSYGPGEKSTVSAAID